MSSRSHAPVVLWFRQDLRLADNPALCFAVKTGRPVIPVYIHDDQSPGKWRAGRAGRWWLHHSLTALQTNLKAYGLDLIIRSGHAEKIIDKLTEETGAEAVIWNRQYEPWAVHRDKEIKARLKERDIEAKSFQAALLFEPWDVKTKTANSFYKVYTPFMKACRAREEFIRPPMEKPVLKQVNTPDVPTESLESLKLYDAEHWPDDRWQDIWQPGEEGAHLQLNRFLDSGLYEYAEGRNYPAEKNEAVSRLSAHLHWGEISPFQIWEAVRKKKAGTDGETYLNEILWREFASHLLYNLPDLPEKPMNRKFDNFEWMQSDAALVAWQEGRTGYPIIDAGMRQLQETGWMHNRVRMITASFLVKNLQLDWRCGQDWFWDMLVDADLANNAMGWQWVAGCGPDAAPFFRIFNPVTQSQKFDPKGEYIRRYVPELKDTPDKYIHVPWTLPDNSAGHIDYPAPIVDHKATRERALEKYKAIK